MQLVLLLQREVGNWHVQLIRYGALHPVYKVPIALSLQVPAQWMKSGMQWHAKLQLEV